jgi:multiple sugar transport system permease protein
MELGRNRVERIFLIVVLTVWTLFTLFPLYWTFVTSLKHPEDVYGLRPTFFPFVDFWPTLQPWLSIFGLGQAELYDTGGLGQVGQLMTNSLLAALGSAFLAVCLGALAAYGLARFRYRRWKNRDIAFWFISQRMLPPIALAVPFFILFNYLNLLDTVFALILVYAAMNLPLVIWLLRDYFGDLPVEIEEAAMVDGCSRLSAFWRIALPLAAPGLVVAFLLSFVFAWNEFLFAFTLTFNDAKTLPIQLAGNVTLRGPRYWDIAAQGAIVLLPPIGVALLAGRYIVRGLAMGAVK